MKAQLLAASLLLAACQTTEPPPAPAEIEQPEQWQLRRPGDENLPMGPAHVPPPAPDPLVPPQTEEEYYEMLRKNLPEGAEAPRPEHQQPMPGFITRTSSVLR